MAATPATVDAALELIGRSDFRSAAAVLEQVSRDAPNDAHARFLLGASYHALGRLREALAAFEAALALAPQHLEAGQAAVAVLCQLGRPREALERCSRLLALAPNDPRVHFNAALAYETAGEPEAALRRYEAALALDGRMRDAALNRGGVLLRLGRHPAALESNRALVAAFPDDVEARFNLAETYLALSRYQEALAQCEHALALAPAAWNLHFERGLALAALGTIDEAKAAFAEARRLNPVGFAARERSVQHGTAEAIDAREIYLARGFEALDACDWTDRNRYLQRFAAWIDSDGAPPPATPALVWRAVAAGLAPEHQLKLATHASARIAGNAAKPPASTGPTRRGERIRIGYVSPDFRDHAVGWLSEDLYARHDSASFETFAYALAAGEGSDVRKRIAADVDVFRDVSGASTAAIAAQIRADAIDVLVDLSGYTLDARPEVFAMRPAPVGAAYLGYPGTSGAPFVDYLIADRVVVPPGHERYFSERLVYLPDTVWCYGCPALLDGRPSREALGLPPSGFVFAALHNAYKICPEIFDTWMTLLARVEQSVLWVLARRDAVRENLRREAARRGVDPDRIVFAGPTPYRAHLARLCAADLFLDTPAYSAGTTCLDALWAGLPVLACPAGSYAGRQSASALAAAGLHELIATGLDDYLARAMRLASDPGAFAAIKARVAASRCESPLFDVAARVRELETAFRAMVERARAGLPPAALAVAPGGRSATFVK